MKWSRPSLGSVVCCPKPTWDTKKTKKKKLKTPITKHTQEGRVREGLAGCKIYKAVLENPAENFRYCFVEDSFASVTTRTKNRDMRVRKSNLYLKHVRILRGVYSIFKYTQDAWTLSSIRGFSPLPVKSNFWYSSSIIVSLLTTCTEETMTSLFPLPVHR